MDEEEMIRQAMSIIGRKKTTKKAAASVENGKKGGRPKGTPMSEETRQRIAATKRANAERDRAERLGNNGQ